MKKKYLAVILAVAMTVTGADATALVANAADLSTEETAVQTEEENAADVETEEIFEDNTDEEFLTEAEDEATDEIAVDEEYSEEAEEDEAGGKFRKIQDCFQMELYRKQTLIQKMLLH